MDRQVASQEFLGALPGTGGRAGLMEHRGLAVMERVPRFFLDVDLGVAAVAHGLFHPGHLVARDERVAAAEVELDRSADLG
jgi:hypothetical protein